MWTHNVDRILQVIRAVSDDSKCRKQTNKNNIMYGFFFTYTYVSRFNHQDEVFHRT